MATQTGAVADVTATGSYTPAAGSNRVLIFCIQYVDNSTTTTISAVMLGAVSAHRIGGTQQNAGTNDHYVDLWYMNEADGIPAGASSFAVTFSASPASSRIAACTIQDADQSDFSVVASNTTASDTTISASLTSLDNSVIVASVDLQHNASNTGITWPASYVEINDRTTGAPTQRVSAAYKNVTTGASETINPSWAAAVAGALYAVLVKNFSAGGGVTLAGRRSLLGVGR